jgi:hypothetical protein
MAIPKGSSSADVEQPITAFGEQCQYYLWRAEEQRRRAREMMKRARDVHDRAERMSKPPIFREKPTVPVGTRLAQFDAW